VVQYENEPSITQPPVSVLICAKNEELNLKTNIPSFLNQNYPKHEVLIVDDGSEDQTATLIKSMQSKERYLKYHKVIKNKDGKKGALLEGIDNTRHSWLLLSDADCKPSSIHWITKIISAAINQNVKIILGYSPYLNSGSLLHHWIHFEGWLTGVLYLSFAKLGMSYMGVGRNLLYHKSVLDKAVITKNIDLSSGDDDLTINAISHFENTGFCIDPDTFTYSKPSGSWSEYFEQKIRHFSTAHRYKLTHKFMLSFYSLSQVLLFILLSFLLINKAYTLVLVLYFTRLLLLLPLVKQLMVKLNATFKLWMFPLLDFGQAFYYLFFSFAVLFPKKKTW